MTIHSASPYFPARDIPAILGKIRKVLKTGHLILGEHTVEFEQRFARYVGVKYAVSVNSGTSALEIPLRHFDVRGREVIVPTNSFIASANAVVFAGGKPVLADIDPKTLCIDPSEIARRRTSRTKCVMVVHIAGLPCPQIGEIKKYCARHGLFLIEDCAHALGASLNGTRAGGFGDAGSFSFFPTKIITTGEGGMITTNDEALYKKAMSLRFHGKAERGNLLENLGYNWRLAEIPAILGVHQMRNIDRFLRRRRAIARQYDRTLRDVPGVALFPVSRSAEHSYYKYPILLDSADCRDRFILGMKEKGIDIGTVYWPPIHLQPLYLKKFGCRRGMLPIAEDVLYRTVCLPIHAKITDGDVRQVVRTTSVIVSSIIGESC